MWALVLHDISYADAEVAVVRLARERHYIDPADIRGEVRRIRAERIDAAERGDRLVPNVDPGQPDAYQAELKALRAAAAAGSLDVDLYAAGGFTLTGEPPLRALDDHSAFRALPEIGGGR